jgi:hypothetical protein
VSAMTEDERELDDARGVAATLGGPRWERGRTGRWRCHVNGLYVGYVAQDGRDWGQRTCLIELNVRSTVGDRYPSREAAMQVVEDRVLSCGGGGLALAILSEIFVEAEVEAEAAVSQWLGPC